MILEQGDAVFVPLRGRRIKLLGSVVRPAEYELSEYDDLIDVLAAGGGFAPSARRQRITIHRVLRPRDRGPGLSGRAAIDLGLESAQDTAASNYLGGVIIPPVGLQDGDSIVVDELPGLLGGYYVTIEGRVQTPGQFPWRQGMTLRELMDLARGPVVGADLREAEVSRLAEDRVEGQIATLHRVPMDSSYLSQRDPAGAFAGPPGVAFLPPGTSPEFELEPYDEIVILRQPDFEMQRSVFITGEVPVPGRYALETKSDRVADLVGRAGGLLNTAYPDGARLYRPADDLGRINIELPRALAAPDGIDNVTLEPGDSLHIPVYSPTVEVQGAVNSPVTVLFQEGRSFDYYIENAGGYRNDADKGRASVRYANGQAELRNKFLFWSSYPDPGPGSTISVPAQDPNNRFDTRGLITDLVAILGSMTTVIVVLTR